MVSTSSVQCWACPVYFVFSVKGIAFHMLWLWHNSAATETELFRIIWSISWLINLWWLLASATLLLDNSMVSYQKGPTCHAYAWQIGPFWQDTLDMRDEQVIYKAEFQLPVLFQCLEMTENVSWNKINTTSDNFCILGPNAFGTGDFNSLRPGDAYMHR